MALPSLWYSDESLPVGRDIAGIAHRNEQVVRRFAQDVHNLKGGRLLPFDAEGIDGIDQGHRILLGQRAHNVQRLVEIPADSHDLSTVHNGLGQLAQGDLALGDNDDGLRARTVLRRPPPRRWCCRWRRR